MRRKSGQVLIVHNRRTPEGKVRQEVLHSFASPVELEEVLEAGWASFRESMEWRHGEYRWRWVWLQSKLAETLDDWAAEPSGAAVRRGKRVGRLSAELTATLDGLSPAVAGHRTLLDEVRPALSELQGTLTRVLEPRPGRAMTQASKGPAASSSMVAEAEERFDEGMERWWRGDRRGACRLYRKALELDPLHADANNHLGIERMERGRLGEAERYLLVAIEGGERQLLRELGQTPWSHLENRPFLRALANLALLRCQQDRHHEAVEIWERLLTLNPNDNQGVRWLLGEGYHRTGELDLAIEAYQRALEEPGCCYSLALALHETQQDDAVGLSLLRAFGANRYIAPMLLGERWKALDGYHGMNLAEPEWAADYVERVGDLWRRVPSAAELLRRWWQAEPVRDWIAQVDETIIQLGRLRPGSDRGDVIARQRGLLAEPTMRKVAGEVDPRTSPGLLKRPFVASPDEVRITREGDCAVIEYADDTIQTTRLVLGPEVQQMSEEEILRRHNEVLMAQEQLCAEYEHIAVEIPPGKPQVEYSADSTTWVPRGDVLRCVIEDGAAGEGPTIYIDDYGLSLGDFGKLLEVYAGWGMRVTFVPDDELHEEPAIEVREPSREER